MGTGEGGGIRTCLPKSVDKVDGMPERSFLSRCALYTVDVFYVDRASKGRFISMLNKEVKITTLSESERMELAEKAVEAIIGQPRRKKGTVRRTRRD